MLAQLRIRESVGLAAASNLLKARRCVAEALAISSWDISVGTVAQLDPPAFRRAVDHPPTRPFASHLAWSGVCPLLAVWGSGSPGGGGGGVLVERLQAGRRSPFIHRQ